MKPARISKKPPGLLILATILLTSCNGAAPVLSYPAMTDAQKEELRTVCNNDDDKKHFDPECRELEAWFQAIATLRRQIEN